MSIFLISVGEKIRTFRKSKGLTQEELAEKVQLQSSYIGSIERGERNISLLTLQKILDGLEVSLEIFFRKENLEQREIVSKLVSSLNFRSEDEVKLIYNLTEELVRFLDKNRK
ncbi:MULTISPECIES: helix-turn-helix domain-containing protein [unclassified Bacillus (in: firmicutes)]|uniref:helix-turn-helix domain-containing protein n=1 Tax=unclassified Bacillus (in: firmicutes) TaxID=185979 RepID=UPI0008E1E65F|nr:MULTISPECIES: helix-turn-helix transcriptional regulator [unclassified Bacillus (in: firmicutes)]SFA99484.1 Helix-turn-helix [Bacillus sp. UNCCL13]SFQ81671.1 Helix-turn-helix [Bacillus sp. cl95]